MSGDVMTFPNTWEEYEEQYGFNDTEQVYTNGSRLIQSFRVKQWLEHIEVSEDNKAYTYCSRCGMKVVVDAPSVVPTVRKNRQVERADWIKDTYKVERIEE